MDELAAKMADKTKKPENQKNNKDSPEHKISFGLKSLLFRVRRRRCAYRFFPIGQTLANPASFYINSNKFSGGQKGEILQMFSALLVLQTPLSMRSNLLTSFLIAMLLAGCAFEGVVVEKRSRQTPDSSMIGTEGVDSFAFRGPTGTSRPPITVPSPQFWTETNGRYSFLLRDRQGKAHSQMVTPEVFARYRVGDYFNDQQSPPEHSDSKSSKTVVAVVQQRRHHQAVRTRRTHRKSVRRAGEIPKPNHQIPSNLQSFNLQLRIGERFIF
jgi:hypothetical protein